MLRATNYLAASALALFLIANSSPTFAVTAEVAKKCEILLNKAFPPRVPGNPAAGSAKGSGHDAQLYFKKCVASGGKPPNESPEKDK
jgi:hypothetical protein